MDATILSELDTLFKEIEGLHRAVNKGSVSLIEKDLLADKIKIYYSLLSKYNPSIQPSHKPFVEEKKENEVITSNVSIQSNQEIEEKPEVLEKKSIETLESPIQYNFNTTYSKRKELKNLIDINTRIGLIKYFFHGNLDEYNAALTKLDQTNSFQEAEKLLIELCNKQGFDQDHDLYQALNNIVRRSF